MLKTLFEQMIEQYGGEQAWQTIKLPQSESPFIKYLFHANCSKYVMIVELDMIYHKYNLHTLLTFINRDMVKIISLKFLLTSCQCPHQNKNIKRSLHSGLKCQVGIHINKYIGL